MKEILEKERITIDTVTFIKDVWNERTPLRTALPAP